MRAQRGKRFILRKQKEATRLVAKQGTDRKIEREANRLLNLTKEHRPERYGPAKSGCYREGDMDRFNSLENPFGDGMETMAKDRLGRVQVMDVERLRQRQ